MPLRISTEFVDHYKDVSSKSEPSTARLVVSSLKARDKHEPTANFRYKKTDSRRLLLSITT